MENQSKKLSLSDFKKKVNDRNSKDGLDLISGGILGACHCVTVNFSTGWTVEYCVYYN
jgi:hypothetical protein